MRFFTARAVKGFLLITGLACVVFLYVFIGWITSLQELAVETSLETMALQEKVNGLERMAWGKVRVTPRVWFEPSEDGMFFKVYWQIDTSTVEVDTTGLRQEVLTRDTYE
jgi:hypothetical protein